MSSIVVSHYRASLIRLLNKFGLSEENLAIVPNIRTYCASLGHPELELNEQRVAKCLHADGNVPIFLLREKITDDLRTICMVPLFARNFPNEDIDKLADPKALVHHLLLHEIRHHYAKEEHKGLTLNEVERDCDNWAFEQLGDLSEA
jgi:hypothetical protein